MKLIDQYIIAIGRKLPYKSRIEIKKEIKSSLIDEIEARFGSDPTEKEVKAIIQNYGSPREVANRYKSSHIVIGEGYTDLYFFIAKIIVFAISIAFITLFILSLFTEALNLSTGTSTNPMIEYNFFTSPETFNTVMTELAKVIARIIQGSISGVGWLTLVFIIMTRVNNDKSIDLEEDWTPNELKDIQIGPEVESRLASVFSIFFTLVFIIIINTFPGLITLSENSFDFSGLLKHSVNIDVFRQYLIPLSMVWFGTLIYHILNLFYGRQSRNLALLDLALEVISASIFITMIFSSNLYLEYTGLIGYQLLFGIIAIISSIEAINKLIKYIRYYLLNPE